MGLISVLLKKFNYAHIYYTAFFFLLTEHIFNLYLPEKIFHAA